jgi:hypothetical protein
MLFPNKYRSDNTGPEMLGRIAFLIIALLILASML